MVKVKEAPALVTGELINLEPWLCQLAELRPELNLARIRDVCELAEQAEQKALASNSIWAEGRSSYRTGLQMADLLSELQVDEDGLVAAIIYRAVRENQLTLNHVKKQFGKEVAKLIEGVLKMAAISEMQFGQRKKVLGQGEDQMVKAKRMLVSLLDDVRVALLKLAERTSIIREGVRNPNPRSLRLAKEVFEIYAPLAHRLGIGHLKWELEDLSFRLLEPLRYKRIAKLLDEKRTVRQAYVASVSNELAQRLRQAGIEAQVVGRAKHIYSIWRKMHHKQIPFSEVYDARAVRILVQREEDCYRVLGIVHRLWWHIQNEFDDYIANPKENGYQSLHTAVIGPEGKVLEVQIRTEAMHEQAEFGVCSHWQYKGPAGKEEPSDYQRRLEWLRQLLDGQDEELSDLSIMGDISSERIYVFTPEGDLLDMTADATPLDFAYRVHTEIGHKCRGAKVNGRVVPLNTKLSSGDRIEVIVGEEVEPRREWLHEHLGYVATSKARGKIQAFFGKRERQKNIDEGKRILVQELNYLGVENLELSQLVADSGYESAEQLFYDLALGDLSVVDLVAGTAELMDFGVGQGELDLELSDQAADEPLVTGQGGLGYQMADCCQPVPGDSILGVIGSEGSVLVHRQDCLQALKADVMDQQIRLEWKREAKATFPVSIEVQAHDRPGLLYDIAGVLMQDETNVQSINTQRDRQTSRVTLQMSIEVAQLNSLLQTLEKIEQLANVVSARRTTA